MAKTRMNPHPNWQKEKAVNRSQQFGAISWGWTRRHPGSARAPQLSAASAKLPRYDRHGRVREGR